MVRLASICAILLILFTSSPIHAQSGDCNEFETIQSIILSEATHQPYEAQLEVARVAVTHGVCNLDRNFYTGYGVAERIRTQADDGNAQCIRSTHCRAYFLLYTIDPDIREPAARASHYALTESPRIARYHFDNRLSTAYWWDSPRACPSGWFIISELKVC